MGNIQSKTQIPDKKNFQILDYGYCRVWKRKIDALEIMEEYPVFIESQQRLNSFQTLWPLRTNHPLLVNAYHFSHHQVDTFCGNAIKGSIFTQRVPFRLSQFTNIKYPELITIMKSCIEGYKLLYENFGRFCIRSTMIGFTQHFQTKIWFHTDFSQPEPENPNCKSLTEMFSSLVKAIQSTSEDNHYYCPKFSQFVAQTNYTYFSKDFDWLLKGLENYASKLVINKVQDLKSLRSYIKIPVGWEKLKVKKQYPQIFFQRTEKNRNLSNNIKNVNSFTSLSNKNENHFHIPSVGDKMKFSSKKYQNETYNRVFSNEQVSQKHMNYLKQPIIPSNISRIDFNKISGQNKTKKQEIRFWRSSQKKNPSLSKNKIASPFGGILNKKKIDQLIQQIIQKPQSSEYFSSSIQNAKQISFKQSLQTHNDSIGRKSFNVSTATKNKDKESTLQFSLIQDLQILQNTITPHR